MLSCSINNRVHPTYEQCSHENGRINCVEPNLQCLSKPKSFERWSDNSSVALRANIVASCDNRILLSADFCQMEMRLLAVLSGDQALLQQLNDAHPFAALAQRLSKAHRLSRVMSRADAKAVFYAWVYGGGAALVVRRLSCTSTQAASIVVDLNRTYAQLVAWRRSFVDECRYRDNTVETPIWARRRKINDLNSPHLSTRDAAVRRCINCVVQATASDVFKTVLVNLRYNLHRLQSPTTKIVMILHDEIVLDVMSSDVARAAQLLREVMSVAVSRSIPPLPVRIKSGKNWAQLKEIDF